MRCHNYLVRAAKFRSISVQQLWPLSREKGSLSCPKCLDIRPCFFGFHTKCSLTCQTCCDIRPHFFVVSYGVIFIVPDLLWHKATGFFLSHTEWSLSGQTCCDIRLQFFWSHTEWSLSCLTCRDVRPWLTSCSLIQGPPLFRLPFMASKRDWAPALTWIPTGPNTLVNTSVAAW